MRHNPNDRWLARYQKTQPQNPHALPVRQHIFPRASLQRFTGVDGLVHVHRLPNHRRDRIKPVDETFVVRRAWDARSESGWMKGIEDRFQAIASRLATGGQVIDSEDNRTITEFHALWRVRAWMRFNRYDRHHAGILGVRHPLSKDDEERLEKVGIGFIRGDGYTPSHIANGMSAQLQVMQIWKQNKAFRWFVLAAAAGEFVIPDQPTVALVPITPTLCLVGSGHDNVVSEIDVAMINGQSIRGCHRYFMARDLDQAPIADAPLTEHRQAWAVRYPYRPPSHRLT